MNLRENKRGRVSAGTSGGFEELLDRATRKMRGPGWPGGTPGVPSTKGLGMTVARRQHRQDFGLGFFLAVGLPVDGLPFAGFRTGTRRGSAADQVGQCRILQNPGSLIAYFQKH